jgi:hypothetical protein
MGKKKSQFLIKNPVLKVLGLILFTLDSLFFAIFGRHSIEVAFPILGRVYTLSLLFRCVCGLAVGCLVFFVLLLVEKMLGTHSGARKKKTNRHV